MKNTLKLGLLALFVILCAAVFSCASSAPVNQSSFEWKVQGDQGNGGSSTITMTEETQDGLPAYSFTGKITNKYEYGFVNVQLYPDDATLEQLKHAKALSFRVIGDGEPLAVKINTSDVKDYAYFEYRFDTVDGQPMTIIVPVEHLMQPSWGKPVAAMVNTELAEFVEFQTTLNGRPSPFAFKLWDFRVHTKGIPKEKDILPKGAVKPKAAAAAGEKPIGGDLGAMEVILSDNFEYGDGYQALITDKRLFNGHKIVPGESYTLKITYSASRDLEEIVEVGLVDPSPEASYWRALTWDDAKDVKMAALPKSKAGEVVSATLKFTTLAGATGANAGKNALVIQTKGAGSKGAKGSGKQKAVTFKFTEFVFSKD